MKFTSFKSWLNENTKDGITVLLPGGFKPMHIGHVDLVRRYAEHPDVKEVIVLIGPGVRNGISQKESLEVANLLLKDFDNVTVQAVIYPSPVLTIYKYIETAEPGTYAMGAVRKGKDDEDYKRVLKFVENFSPGGKYYEGKPKGVNIIELGVNTEPIYYHGRTDENDEKPISASILRRDILNDDYNNFRTNYPGYDEDTIKAIWDTTQMVITETDIATYDDVINESKKENGLCKCDANHCLWDYIHQGYGKAVSCEKECWMEKEKDKRYNWREYYAQVHPKEYKQFCEDVASGAKFYPAFKGTKK